LSDELAGKVAIVTGGASGIGRASIERFAAEGARVVIADIDADAGEELSAALGDVAAFKQTDVSSADDVQALVDFTVEHFGGLHVMFNNAGVASAMTRFLHDDLDDFRRVVDINVFGVLLGCQRAARHMKANGGGSIINASSTEGLGGMANTVAYGATKFAIRGMTKGASHELGPFNIRVNSVHPGGVDTQMVRLPEFGEVDTEAAFAAQPIGRVGQPEEIAKMMVFLASDDSSFSTGAEFIADGGYTCGPPLPQIEE